MRLEKHSPKWWRMYYRCQELLDKNFIEDFMDNGDVGDVRQQSTLPLELNKSAERMADTFLAMNEYKNFGEYLEAHKNVEINGFNRDDYIDSLRYHLIGMKLQAGMELNEEDCPQPKMQFNLSYVTQASYNLLLEDLDDDLRAFIDDDVVADHYVIAMDMDTQEILGGFTYMDTGVIGATFVFQKGFGSKLMGSAITFVQDNAEKLFGYMFLDCYGDFLRSFYEKFGFEVTTSREFKEELAPEGWNKERFGLPTYYEMRKVL